MSEDKDIQKGFNQGYILSQHKPELANKVFKSLDEKNGPYQLGFKKGYQQFQIEHIKSIEQKSPIIKVRADSKDLKKSKNKDKSDRDR